MGIYISIYIIIYIVFTCIHIGVMLKNSKEKLSEFDWFFIISFGWLVIPIFILIVTFLIKLYHF